MSSTTTLEQVAQMSVPERLAVIADIWDSIAAEDTALPVSDELGAEFDRRLERHRGNPNEARDWSVIRDEA